MRKLLATALMAASLSAHADFFSGNDLLQRLTAGDGTISRAVGIGYVAGVLDATIGIHHCAPHGISVKQATDVVQKALELSPEDRHFAAEAHVRRALAIAWPCKNQSKSKSTL